MWFNYILREVLIDNSLEKEAIVIVNKFTFETKVVVNINHYILKAIETGLNGSLLFFD